MKKSLSFLSTILMIVILALTFGACKTNAAKINSLSFISATGTKENTNCLFVSEFATSYMPVTSYDASKLSSESAAKLIDEINAVPDATNAQGPLAYKIEMIYTDKDSSVHEIKKEGYGGFPSNWDTIVQLVNDVAGQPGVVNNSKDIVTIDADYVEKNFGITNADLPEGITVDDLINNVPLTYETLYNPNKGDFEPDKVIYDYLYDFYNIDSHKISVLNPSASTELELKAFADHRLDTIEEEGTISYSGKYLGNDFKIVKYDEFGNLIQNNEYADLEKNSDNSLKFVFDQPAADGGEEGSSYTMDIYVDSSNRFIILTNCTDPTILYHMVK